MRERVEGKKKNIRYKLTTALMLSALFICPKTYSADTDFSYVTFSKPNPIVLVNPKYFVEESPKEIIKVQSKSYGQINQPLEETIKSDTTPSVSEVITTSPPINDFFAPIEITTTPANTIFLERTTNTQEEEGNNNEETTESSICEGVEENNNSKVEILEPDLSNCIIGEIKVEGLKVLNPQIVYANIQTQSGNLFNQDILQQDLQRIYAIGFFTDKMEIEPVVNDDGTVDLTFHINENVYVNDINIIGNTVISSTELLPLAIDLKNYPQNITNINNTIEKINDYYHERGYILANVTSVNDDENGDLTFEISEGIIDKVLIKGNEKTKDYVIRRNIMTVSGSVYNENELKKDLAKIYATNIFKEVDRNIVPSEKEGEYNVEVLLKEDYSNNISIGGGIDNALGVFGSLAYSEKNLFGRGQNLSLSGILGSGILLSDSSIKNRMNYQVELNFFEPYFLNADNSLMSKLYYRELGSYQVPLAIERRIGLMAGVEHKVQSNENLTTSFSAGIEKIKLKEGDYNQISSLYNLRNLDISNRAKELSGGTFFNLAPAVKYSTLDTEINPREGILANAKFIEAISVSNFKTTNGRLAGSVTKYFPVLKKSSFSLTAKGGIKVHGDDMPEVMAFRLGGPYSIRGFKMNGVGSGDSFIMGSAELATPLPFIDRLKWDFVKTLRLNFFVDAGKVFDGTISSILYDRPMSAISAGVGLSIYIPNVGPVSIDYGIPITNPGSYGNTGGYFTFGTGGMNGYGL